MSKKQLLILTDVHIGSNKPDMNVENDEQFARAIDLINALCPRADLLVMMGDLAHTGSQEEYNRFKELIEPLNVPVQLMIGNHDDVGNFSAAFPDDIAEDGFVHRVVDLGSKRLIFLDTVNRGDEKFKAFGELCSQRLAWLAEQLEDAQKAGREVLLFMHHPPVALGMPMMDCIRLRNGPEFYETITPFKNVKHIFCGHVHRQCYAVMNNVPVISFKAITQQAPFFFDDVDPNAWIEESGAFGIVSFDDRSMVIHTQDFDTAGLEVRTSNFADQVSDGEYDLEVVNLARDLLTNP